MPGQCFVLNNFLWLIELSLRMINLVLRLQLVSHWMPPSQAGRPAQRFSESKVPPAVAPRRLRQKGESSRSFLLLRGRRGPGTFGCGKCWPAGNFVKALSNALQASCRPCCRGHHGHGILRAARRCACEED